MQNFINIAGAVVATIDDGARALEDHAKPKVLT